MSFGADRLATRKVILREIAAHGPIARIDLSRITGISRATITTITAEFLRGGLIEEVQRPPEPDTRRGRPRVDLKISGTARFIAGLKIADAEISFVLTDFEGVERAALKRPIARGPHAPADLAAALEAGLRALAQSADCDFEAIAGVGVGVAGLVQAETGIVYWSPSLTERNHPFRDVLQDRLMRPVFIDNDANLVAMAELTFGMGRERRDFIVVTLESGVGMGIILGGQLYRGTRGSGGEFGHTKVALNGALCRCGQRGCLEAYVADYALVREARARGLIDAGTPLEHATADILAAAKQGNPIAAEVVSDAGSMFAMGLANLANIFDPELIILAGAQMQFDHLYADAVMAEMRKSIVKIDKPAPDVLIHKWGNHMWALGAAAYALGFVRDQAIDALDESLAPV